MTDVREFLRVLENKRPGRAVGFEYAWERPLAEQLHWRRGESLWAGEEARVRALCETAHRCGLDCAAVELREEDGRFPGLSAIPDGIPAAAGQTAGLFESGGSLSAHRAALRGLAEHPAVCAVLIRDRGEAVPDRPSFRRAARELTAEVHAAGKPCIWADCGEKPVPLEWAAGCGFDGVHLTAAYSGGTAEFWKEYGGAFAILGGTELDFLCEAKPRDILAHCAALQALTGNRGFAYGTGNPWGRPVPYLSYISTLTALRRGGA